MSTTASVLTMIGLDALMIAFSLWVASMRNSLGRLLPALLVAFAVWLGVLHLGLSTRSFFPDDISGWAFLAVIFSGVGLVGLALLAVKPVRALVERMGNDQLLLLQGVRVFFGAGFLIQASTGDLPAAFGIIDGITHISAGFFGLIAAFAVAACADGARRAWFANLFGLADILVVASTLALVLLPQIGPHHPMMYAVFLPAPLWLWFHLFSIAKMRRARLSAPQPVTGAHGCDDL